MAAKKTDSASAAEVEKKRKRDKTEDGDRVKKRKPQDDEAKQKGGKAKEKEPKESKESKESKELKESKESRKDKKDKKDKKGKDESQTALVVQNSHAPNKNTHTKNNKNFRKTKRPRVESTWKLSEPMGGRISDIDPIFTADEKHLLVTYNTSIQVYSTVDSLLERRIKLLPIEGGSQARQIVSTALSPLSPELLWVAYLDGVLMQVNWMTGEARMIRDSMRQDGSPASQRYELQAMVAVAVPPVSQDSSELSVILSSSSDKKREMLLISEGSIPAWHVSAYDAAKLTGSAGQNRLKKAAGQQLFSHEGQTAIEHLCATSDGRVLFAASGPTIFVGGLQAAQARGDLTFEIFSMDTVDSVSSLDVRANDDRVDLVVGCRRGAIYVYEGLLEKLRSFSSEALAAAAAAAGPAVAEGGKSDKKRLKKAKKSDDLRPRKYHFHLRAVHAVKWSRDGNYLISGGAEMSLVLWQLDTGRREIVPNLAASIENVVVSPQGTSYAVHLDDNSVMVLATADMRPTCYVSGLQALPGQSAVQRKREAGVERVWKPSPGVVKSSDKSGKTVQTLIVRPLPAVIDPTNASRLLLRVGNGQRAMMTDVDNLGLLSASQLQTFDISSFQSVAKQPLARTNMANGRLTLRGFPITEPTITKLCASRDGRWLVSVDDWQPPAHDINGDNVNGVVDPALQAAWARERREVHLKFWSVSQNHTERLLEGDDAKDAKDGDSSGTSLPFYHLETQVDEAHYTTKAESILDVVADSQRANRFATLGADGTVRFWAAKPRLQNGLLMLGRGGRELDSWYCAQTVVLSLGESRVGGGREDREEEEARRARQERTRGSARPSGALAFSEDGSTVFAAFGSGGADEAVLYVIDAESGAIRSTLVDMFRGDVHGVASLGPVLVLLSADLRVYDIVADELRYGLRLEEGSPSALTQLAVGSQQSQTFAVAVGVERERRQRPFSRLFVFSADQREPLFRQELDRAIVSLLPAVGLSGFLAIDDTSQVSSVVDAIDTAALALPLSELNLPLTADEAAGADRQLLGEAQEAAAAAEAEAEDEEMADPEAEEDNKVRAGEGADDDDDDDEDDGSALHAAIVAPQKLRDIFEAAPVSSSSIDDLFWQVTDLLSALPPLVPAGRS